MNNYICQLNENVERIHVRYNNRYGIALAGDLYAAKNIQFFYNIIPLTLLYIIFLKIANSYQQWFIIVNRNDKTVHIIINGTVIMIEISLLHFFLFIVTLTIE